MPAALLLSLAWTLFAWARPRLTEGDPLGPGRRSWRRLCSFAPLFLFAVFPSFPPFFFFLSLSVSVSAAQAVHAPSGTVPSPQLDKMRLLCSVADYVLAH